MPATKFIACVLAFFIFHSGWSQTVKGKVTDKNGSPLSGASVSLLNSKKGVVTAADGTFTVDAKSGDRLEVSMVGFQTELVNVTGITLNIMLQPGESNLSELVVVGSRRQGRVKLETAVPVDVVNISQAALPTARMDVTSILNYAAPSFNYNKQSGSDGADHVELATLRGLGPDQTLVLINGKRRHQTSFVSVFGTRGRGNSGTDLNAIPATAIERIEILRDGAAAQYGSDAIAGVMNIILKKSVRHLNMNVGVSSYYDRKYNTAFSDLNQYVSHGKLDGNAINVNLNYGFPIGDRGGFINFSGDFSSNGKTFRQVLDTNYGAKNALPINPYRRANGDASLTSFGAMYNMELPVKGGTTFYSFGGYNTKASSAYAFTRNLSAKPDRFPQDINGNYFFINGIMHTTPDGEVYYNPLINSSIQDVSAAFGLKGTNKRNWNWDLSNVAGYNKFHFFGHNTFNASAVMAAPQTHFDDGGFSFFQNTANFNMDKEFKSIAKGFHLAVGAEYRAERYKIFAGEESSWKNYNPAKASGAQGFPGYRPSDEVNATRQAYSLYADGEVDVTNKFLLGAAVRTEYYSDFGFTGNFKLAGRYKATDKLNIRGSLSTGFRAPSLQQINYSSAFTTVQGGLIADVKIAPNYSSITKSAGIEPLKQERSINAGLGFTYKPMPNLSVTVDGYLVKVRDRVVLSGQFDAADATLDAGFRDELSRLGVGLAQFFANAVNTTNTGVDVVMEYNKKLANKQHFRALLTANFQTMRINNINVPAKLNDTKEHRQTFLSDREQAFILASAPRTKMGANLEYSYNKFTVGTRLTLFGKVRILGYGEDGLGIDPRVPTDADPSVKVKDEYNYSSKLVTDLYLTFRLNKKIAFYGGVDNLFNIHPDLGYAKGAKYWAYNGESAGPWDAVQMGGNGRRLFTRISFNF